mgnify:CR=1 FL=1
MIELPIGGPKPFRVTSGGSSKMLFVNCRIEINFLKPLTNMETIEIPGILVICLIPTFLLLLFRFYYLLTIIEDYNMYLRHMKLELLKMKRLDIKTEHYFDRSELDITLKLYIDIRKWSLKQIVEDKVLLFEVKRFIKNHRILE